MKPLLKLQRRTLIPLQVIGYALTLLVGMAIIIASFQLYVDIKPILQEETSVFSKNALVVSKTVSVFKTLNKTEKSQVYEIYLSRLQQVKESPPDDSWKGETFRTMH